MSLVETVSAELEAQYAQEEAARKAEFEAQKQLQVTEALNGKLLEMEQEVNSLQETLTAKRSDLESAQAEVAQLTSQEEVPAQG